MRVRQLLKTLDSSQKIKFYGYGFESRILTPRDKEIKIYLESRVLQITLENYKNETYMDVKVC